jgi:tetratricopeptide (TPR) repeat protein
LAESEEQLAELSDSPDPVVQRQIREALYAKARALSKLSRPSEAIEVWDELLLKLALDPSDRAQRVALRALSQKASDLWRLGHQAEAVQTADALLALSETVDRPELVRFCVLIALVVKLSAVAPGERDEAIAINEEMVRRLASAAEPLIHKQVTTALVSLGLSGLLSGRAEDTIDMSVALAERFESAPDEVLAEEADLLNRYGRGLSAIAGTGWRGLGDRVGFLSLSVVTWIGRSLLKRMGRPVDSARDPRMMPSGWKPAQRRLKAAIEMQERLTSRIGSSPDPELERAATISRMQTASARIALGDITRGWRELSPMVDSSDPASAQALHTLAANVRGRSGIASQLDELLLLSLRAEALGGGDVKIQQIAYEDSIQPLVAETRHRSVRWTAALMTPGLLPEALVKAKTAVPNVARRLSGKSQKA